MTIVFYNVGGLVVFLGYAWWKYNRYSKSLDAQARYDEDTPLARIALESQEGKKPQVAIWAVPLCKRISDLSASPRHSLRGTKFPERDFISIQM